VGAKYFQLDCALIGVGRSLQKHTQRTNADRTPEQPDKIEYTPLRGSVRGAALDAKSDFGHAAILQENG
jgi:hypothetical protein